MQQSAVTIVMPIAAGREEELRSALSSQAPDQPGARLLRQFAAIATLHFASLFIIDPEQDLAACLVFEANIDGTAERFLDDLIATAGDAVDDCLKDCVGYPGLLAGGARLVKGYLQQHSHDADAFYVGCPGRAAAQIEREAQLYAGIQTEVDRGLCQAAARSGDLDGAKRAICQEVQGNPTLGWAFDVPPRPFLVRYGAAVLNALLAAAVLVLLLFWWLLLPAFALFLALLRIHEKRDDAVRLRAADMATLRRETAILERESEPGRVQNHLASVTYVKPGRFRLWTLRTFFRVVRLFVALRNNKGRLGGVGGIHFARWVLIDNGRRLLFMSNYDGSWESYLDDFILASDTRQPLTAIFSNTQGFPKTRFLIFGGTADEPRFKAFVADSQVESLVWYSAYPDLTVRVIDNNTALREGLPAEASLAETDRWLQRLGGAGPV